MGRPEKTRLAKGGGQRHKANSDVSRHGETGRLNRQCPNSRKNPRTRKRQGGQNRQETNECIGRQDRIGNMGVD